MSDVVKRLRKQAILIGMVGGDKDLKTLIEEAAAEIARLREEKPPVANELNWLTEPEFAAVKWARDLVAYYADIEDGRQARRGRYHDYRDALTALIARNTRTVV